MIEHVTSYFIEIFRKIDIEKSGVADVHGVPHAKYESMLLALQYFYICFLIGYIV